MTLQGVRTYAEAAPVVSVSEVEHTGWQLGDLSNQEVCNSVSESTDMNRPSKLQYTINQYPEASIVEIVGMEINSRHSRDIPNEEVRISLGEVSDEDSGEGLGFEDQDGLFLCYFLILPYFLILAIVGIAVIYF